MSETRDHIFISYRRDDARGASGRLYDWLRIAFGREHVFRDVHSIGIGKWRDKIDQAIARTKLCVAVIGPRWANADNLPRLHQVDDMVRHELVSALACDNLLLVPTLVEAAELPKAEALPAELRPLFADWNARPITEAGWEDDTRRLIAEIAEGASLRVGSDVDSLLHDVSVARQRVSELEEARQLQTEQLEAQRRAIDDLTRKLAEAAADDRPGLAAAFAALAKGDSRAAEDAFEQEYDAQSRVLDSARQTMAEAAQNVANLALSRDVVKAVTFYRKALEIEPANAKTLVLLGGALTLLGDLQAAKSAFSDCLRVAIADGDELCEMAAQGGLGDVCMQSGDLSGAHVAYSVARGLAEHRLSRDSSNTECQFDISASDSRNGDVLVAQGDCPGALVDYRKSHEMLEALAARDPANTRWQRDLSVSHDRIGDVYVMQGDGPGALAAYRKSLDIREALAARDPANTASQHDLSVSHFQIGDVLLTQGDVPRATAAYRKCLEIFEALAALDPANAWWQRGLSVSHEKIGDALVAQGDGPAALAAYRRSLEIREAPAAGDPANAGCQRELWVSHVKIGDVLVTQGDVPGAMAAYRKSLEIFEALAARNPANTGWQRDLSISHDKIGDVLMAQGDGPGALAAYRKSLDIRAALAARDPTNIAWQRDLSISHDKIGDVLVAQGDRFLAPVAYRKSLEIAEELAARDPANAEWQRDMVISLAKLYDTTGEKVHVVKALKIAEAMHDRGIFAPRDAWMIEELKRLAAE